MDVQLDKVIEALTSHGYSAEKDKEDIRISISINGIDVQLICKLGKFFPYEFPEVSLSAESWKKLPTMPHKYVGGSICTFDKSIAIPNINKPVELVVEVVEKAIRILEEGSIGKNKLDYMDEFLAYWDVNCHDSAQLFIENLTECKKLYWLRDGKRSIISDSYEKAHTLFERALGKEPKQIIKGLLVPTIGSNLELIPKTDVDILKVIKANSPDWEKYNKFVQDNISTESFFIVVTEATDTDKMLFGWMHYGPGVPDGFREGHANLALAFNGSKRAGNAIYIDNCSQKRLYTRGGDGNTFNIDSVCIIGCGSIGSYIADALLSTGIKRISLVDKELLNYENIARHYLGYFWVGHSKADAIKTNLEMHNPNVECYAYPIDAFQFFSDDDVINSHDLVIIAVASAPIEHYAIKLFNEGIIHAPILIMWVEPYAIAGHALLLNRRMNIYEEVFDSETLEYSYSVVKDANQYIKREAGCQSSYMPYSAFQLKEMIYRLLGQCLKDYLGTEKNIRMTWLGRLTEAKAKDIEINDKFLDSKDYSVEVERIG